MRVSIGTSLPLHLEDLPQDEDGPRIELLDGGLLVTPVAGLGHQYVVGELYSCLSVAAPPEWCALPGANVLPRGAQDRLLVPDVLVVDGAVLVEPSPYLDPSDVLLVVEVESPATKSTDRLLKRELYAQWRIPHYWIVDVGERRITKLALTAEHRYDETVAEDSWLAAVDTTSVWPG
ncbi:Uma2 family endonuclease [Kineococcus sp. GCM10028916]|uniref:Uma2 family endonuclease n=1 Tax=Kineococcus sp. GCM10028916 TaxID=3273394 RepID=UPI00362CACE2